MAHDAVDGALAELGGQDEDFGGDLAQAAVLLVQVRQFPPLRGGRTFVPPALNLLRIDIDELQLLAMNSFHPVDGGVVENMRLGTCFRQRLNMVGGVAQGAVDHAGDERHLADGLPVHAFGRGLFRRAGCQVVASPEMPPPLTRQ